jgi:hypothetical protein
MPDGPPYITAKGRTRRRPLQGNLLIAAVAP